MNEFVYYLLAFCSPTAIAKADELKMNPNSYNYKSLSDPRRAGRYLMLVVDPTDGYILNSQQGDPAELKASGIDAIVID